MPALKDIRGQTFRLLTAVRIVSHRPVRWLCVCACGGERVVVGTQLRAGVVPSCGCVQDRRPNGDPAAHGSQNPTWVVWRDMISRCHDPTRHEFSRYGGRGITVCDRWRADFAAFVEDMGPRPPGLQLDRIDNAAGYSKSNCRWATRTQQNRNKRNSRILTFRGEQRTQAEWAELYGISQQTLYRRLRHGWSVERALQTAGGVQ